MELYEEDANISTFRRGNKIIAVGLAVLIISVTLLILIVASAFLLPPILNAYLPHPTIRALSVESFCSYSYTPMCITALNSIVTDRFATDSNQIVALCIQTAAKDLQNLIAASLTRTPRFASENCSDSLHRGSDRVREALTATARAKRPFVGRLSKERDEVVINWLMAAEEDVHFCLRDSAEVESPEPVAQMTEKLEYVKAYLYSAYGFLDRYGRMGEIEMNNAFYIEINIESVFGICLCGVQLLMFGFVCSRFRNRSSRVSLRRIFLSFWNTE